MEKRKSRIGDSVVITLKKDGKTPVQGIIKRLLREDKDEVLVELLDGSIGQVVRTVPRRARMYGSIDVPKQKLRRKEQEKVVDLFSGENKHVEYKTSALWSQDLSKQDLDARNTFETRQYGNRASKIILAKALAAFLNSGGGNLLIGLQEKKESIAIPTIIGIESELKKLRNKDPREDGYRRMIIDEVIRPYFPQEVFNHFSDYFEIFFPRREGKTICHIKVKKSDTHVFITIDGKDSFFIKVDAETRELQGKQIIDYIKRVFG